MVLVCKSGDSAHDISVADSVRVVVRHPDADEPLIDRVAEILDDGTEAKRGQVKLTWQAGDTDMSGIYQVEVEVFWSAGRGQTFPGAGYQKLKISPDLN